MTTTDHNYEATQQVVQLLTDHLFDKNVTIGQVIESLAEYCRRKMLYYNQRLKVTKAEVRKVTNPALLKPMLHKQKNLEVRRDSWRKLGRMLSNTHKKTPGWTNVTTPTPKGNQS